MRLSATQDATMVETVSGALEGALQAEAVRQEISDIENRE